MTGWGLLGLLAIRRAHRESRAVVALVLLGLTTCLVTATAAACVSRADGVVQREGVGRADTAARTIKVLAGPRGDFAETDRAVRRAAARLPGSSTVVSLSSDAYGVRGADARIRAHLVWSADMRSSATLVRGRWPRAAGEVAVPDTAAERLRRGADAALQLVPLLPRQAGPGPLRVTGTYRVPDPEAPAWQDDVRHGRGVLDGDYVVVGPLLVASPDTPGLRGAGEAVWRVAPDVTARLSSDQVAATVATLQGITGTVVVSSLPVLIRQADADAAAVRLAAAGPVLVLLVVAAGAAALCGLVLADLHRRGDELLAARGASRPQLLAVVTLTLAALLPGAAVAAVVGDRLAGRLVDAGTAATDGLLPAAAASLGTVLLMSLAGLLASVRTPDRPRLSLGADLGVLTLAALMWHRAQGLDRADALGLVAPVVGLLAAVLLAARASQALVIVAGLAARRADGLVAPWVVWRLRRRSATGRVTQLLVCLTAAVSTLGLVQVASEDGRLRTEARTVAPASVVVTLDEHTHLAPGRVEDVGDRLGAPWSAAWSRRTVDGPLGSFTVVAVDARSRAVTESAAGQVVEGPSWQDAVAALRSAATPTAGSRPVDPGDLIELTLVDLDQGSREQAARQPFGPVRVLLDDAEGRRFLATLPPASSGAVTHRGRLRDVLGTGAARLRDPLQVASVQFEEPLTRRLRVERIVQRSATGEVRALAEGRRPMRPPTDERGPVAVWQPELGPLPMIVTRSLAQDWGARVGDRVTADVGDGAGAVTGTVVAVTDALTGPGADGSPVALVDLASWQQRSSRQVREPVPLTQVWSLAPASARAAVTPGRDGVRDVTTYADELDRARGRVVPTLHRWVLLGLVVGTAMVAVLGILAAAGAGARGDVRSAAVLHALGAPRSTHRRVARLLGWVHTLLGVVLGCVAGLALAPLTVPVWRTTPEVVVELPWGWVVVAALVLAVLLGAASAAAARSGAPRPAAVLRTGDDR